MAGNRPTVADGFLGSLPTFSEAKLKTKSHKTPEFKLRANREVIELTTGVPIKTVTKLIQCDGEKELPEYTLSQRKDKTSIFFHLGFPASGWYKFSIFALQESDPKESLPNVYNYLIEVEVPKPARTYPKVYTKFYTDYCVLEQPMVLNAQQKRLDQVKFDLLVPGAFKVAVHAGDEWFQLTKDGNKWSDTLDLHEHATPGSKVQVMASYEAEACSYTALLEYTL